eukprot:COSAG01_NODE_319_length_18909_cov_32.636151_10_plen_46_part_00
MLCSGKTTILKLLEGELVPDTGAVPPPRHQYPDRNSELTEIYLRF